MIPNSVSVIDLKENIWSVAPASNSNALFIELRNESQKTTSIISVDLDFQKVLHLDFIPKWWDKLVGEKDDSLYFIEYLDKKDPNMHAIYSVDIRSTLRESHDQLPIFETNSFQPSIYEVNTDYHRLVCEFLALELPLGCEYLEWNNKIILSYYLRSDNGFDRYLLLLRDGKKEWKVTQDVSMNGFSSGSFFVFKDQIVFIKDRNEVCFSPI